MGRSGNPAARAWQPMQRGHVNPVLADHHRKENPPGTLIEAWGNDIYDAIVCRRPDGMVHVSFKRHDRAPVRDWRHMQQLKNEICGPEFEAVEIFPRESRLVDQANQIHLWVLPEGVSVPFGYDNGAPQLLTHEEIERMNREHGGKGRQRPWQPGLTTGLGGARSA